MNIKPYCGKVEATFGSSLFDTLLTTFLSLAEHPTATLVGAHTLPRHAPCLPPPLPALLLPLIKGQMPNCPFACWRQKRTCLDPEKIETGTTTKIGTTMYRKSGAVAHPADRATPHK